MRETRRLGGPSKTDNARWYESPFPPSSFRFLGGAHFLGEIDSLLEEGGDKERIDRGWRRRMSHGNSENALNKIIIDSVRVSEHNRSCCVWAHADSP